MSIDTRLDGPDLHDWLADDLARRKAWIAACIAAASGFLFVVDSAFVSMSLPHIERQFPNAPRGTVAWVASAFIIAQASLLLIAGRLGDRRGRKRFFLRGVLLFSVGALCAAAAPTLPVIIAARAIQGVGAAFLTSGALAIVLPMFPRARAASVVGTWGAVGSVAGWLTPLVGPALVNVSWRLAFVAIAPIGLLIYVVGARVLPEQTGEHVAGRTDRVGLLVGPPALGLLMLVLARGGGWGWTSPRTLWLGVVVVALLGTFVWRSTVARLPLLDLSLLKHRGYVANIVAGALQQAGFFGWFITAPLIMTNLWGWSPWHIGLALALSQLLSTIGAPLGGWLVRHMEYRTVCAIGAMITAAGTLWMVLTTGPHDNVATGYVPAALLFGLGCSMCGTLTSGSALAALPAAMIGSGNSLMQLIRRMGGAMGVAVAVALLGDGKGVELLDGGRRVWWMVTAVHVLILVPLALSVERGAHRPVALRSAQ